MSWGITVSGDPVTVVAKFQSFSDAYQNSTMVEAEKAIIAKLASDIVPMLCADIGMPVQIEASGSEGNWGPGYGYQRNVALKFSNIPGWVATEAT